MAQGRRLGGLGDALILVIDNYDSFVHNLARLVRLSGEETRVVRNDAIDANEVEALRPDAILLSPGPGQPNAAGCTLEVAQKLSPTTPMLGVCLGHQAIVEALGGRVARAPNPMHGRVSQVEHDRVDLFDGLPSPLQVCRYHSLAADETTLPPKLRISARSEDGVVMAIAHESLPLYGVQFHPESILTEHGQQLINNFAALARRWPRR